MQKPLPQVTCGLPEQTNLVYTIEILQVVAALLVQLCRITAGLGTQESLHCKALGARMNFILQWALSPTLHKISPTSLHSASKP